MLTFRLSALSEIRFDAVSILKRFGLTSTSSIRFQLFLVLSLVAVLPLLFLSSVLSSKLRRSALNDAQEHVAIVANEVGERIGELMLTVERHLESLQSNPRLRAPESSVQENQDEMRRLLSIYDDFHDISLYRPNGDIIASTNEDGPDPAPYHEHTSWFQNAVASGERTVSRPTRRIGLEGMFLVVYLPIRNEEGQIHSVMRASLQFGRIQSVLENIDLAKAGRFMLVDELGLVLYDPDPRPLPRKLETEFGWDEWLSHPEGECEVKGVASVYATRLMSMPETRVGCHWLLIGHLPRIKALTTVESAIGTIWGSLVISAIGVLLVSTYVSNRLVDQLSPLIGASHSVAAGKWEEVDLPEDGPDEIKALSNSFVEMIGEIRQHQDTLEYQVAKRTEELLQKRRQLANANAQLEATIESTLEGVLVVDRHGEVRTANRRFLEFFSLPTESDDTITVADLNQRAEELIKDLRGFNGFDQLLELPANDGDLRQRNEAEWHIHGEDQRYLHVYSVDVRSGGNDLAKLWVLRDFTESRMLQCNLQQAQKMEAVGRLAGGIAHDFNNLLTGIIGNLAMVHFDIDPTKPCINELESALNAANRAAELVKQLLGYSRQSFLNMDIYQPNHLVEEVTKLLTSTFDPKIRIETELTQDIWRVKADGTQINQVLMNLCVNAKDAMEEKGKGGHLKLQTENVDLQLKDMRGILHKNAKPGKYVRISVSDDGSGIPAHVVERMFDPFFTTKEQGKGTGLGLSTSTGIVEQHGGWMNCKTKLDEGTTFEVYLPMSESAPESKEKSQIIAAALRPATGSETILLVDDEVLVRNVAEKCLQRSGFSVLTAEDGQDGLEVYHQNVNEIDLVMLDLTMPRLSGAETFRELRKRCPELPIIICSGYVVDVDQFEAENGSRPDAILCKPFDLPGLVNLIRKILDEPELSIAA